MKNIRDITPNIGAQAPQRQAEPTNDQRAKLVLDKTFESLSLVYASSFKYTFADPTVLDRTKQLWLIAFIENDITNAETVKRGLARARADTESFFPSVGKFIHWCTVEPEDGSFERFINRDLRCFAERHTAHLVGLDCRARLEASKAKKLWYETLSRTKKRMRDGELHEPKQNTQTIEAPRQSYDQNQMDRVIDDMVAKGHISSIRGPLRKRFEQRVQLGSIKLESKNGDRHE